MNELLTTPGERKLYYDGPNYAADAVILDLDAEKILLIERADTGEWALPGGFIDPTGESSLEAALREAEEEAGVSGLEGGQLCYRGRTSDRRSTPTSWIETSAHLFHLSSETDLMAGDDASAAAWHSLGALPALYGAHQMIIERALDYSDGEQLFTIIDSTESKEPVEGGYMQYDKWIARADGERAFVKASPEGHDRYEELQSYIEKEAGIMAHLRRSGFRHVPEKSAIRGNQLAMEAFRPEDGWQWQMEEATMGKYLKEVFEAFDELGEIPLPPDTTDVEDSYDSILGEGWGMFDQGTYRDLVIKYPSLLEALPDNARQSAEKLLVEVPALKELVETMPTSERSVLCHYDIRQANFAWHPEKGVKFIDWSWGGPGLPNADATSLLIDLHKNGYDITEYLGHISPEHCINMIGFWLRRATLPNKGAEGLREQQFMSAVSAYELLAMQP